MYLSIYKGFYTNLNSSLPLDLPFRMKISKLKSTKRLFSKFTNKGAGKVTWFKFKFKNITISHPLPTCFSPKDWKKHSHNSSIKIPLTELFFLKLAYTGMKSVCKISTEYFHRSPNKNRNTKIQTGIFTHSSNIVLGKLDGQLLPLLELGAPRVPDNKGSWHLILLFRTFATHSRSVLTPTLSTLSPITFLATWTTNNHFRMIE